MQCPLMEYCCLSHTGSSLMYQHTDQWIQIWAGQWTVEELESNNQNHCLITKSPAYLVLYHYTCTCTYNVQFGMSFARYRNLKTKVKKIVLFIYVNAIIIAQKCRDNCMAKVPFRLSNNTKALNAFLGCLKKPSPESESHNALRRLGLY